MNWQIIAIRFIDQGNYGKEVEKTNYYIYSSNVPFNFDKFYEDLETLHEKNEAEVPFDDEIARVARKHGLNKTDVSEYDYRY